MRRFVKGSRLDGLLRLSPAAGRGSDERPLPKSVLRFMADVRETQTKVDVKFLTLKRKQGARVWLCGSASPTTTGRTERTAVLHSTKLYESSYAREQRPA